MNDKVSQELLDVVDIDDNIIARKTRGEIHAQGLMHRAVHTLVFNDSGDLFLQKRSMSKDNNPGAWDSSSAGHVDSGEDYDGCVLREIEEELGVTVTAPCEYLFKLPPTSATGMEHCKIYRTVHNGPFVLQEEEIDAGRWVSADEMNRRVDGDDPTITEVLKIIWRRFRALDKKLSEV